MLTGINSNTGSNIQLGAGLISLTKITADTLINDEWKKANILTATNGGISVALVPEYFTPSIDGNFDNVMGTGKTITRWTATVTTTAVETEVKMLQTALGVSDLNGDTIKVRHTIKPTDYKDLYVVAERGDGALIQVTLKNAMNTTGMTLSTANNGNGGISLSLSANYDVTKQDELPFEIEVIVPAGE